MPPTPYTYSHLIPPPKSKSPFYATSPHWSNITPIPLNEAGPPDLDPAHGGTDPGPALATIAYSQRYLEAMSYLRALLAVDERSERGLALTEDVIGMNPAHYTVWLYRMGCLKSLLGVDSGGESGVGTRGEEDRKVVEVEDDDGGDEWEDEDEDAKTARKLKEGIERELQWLEAISERNLKNYQIWHHRQSLLSLYPHPSLPNRPNPHPYPAFSTYIHETEIPFLSHILSFDAKNYHVWTYRQWLCRRYPQYLLPPSSESEIEAMEVLVDMDVRNNSAWSHRYFAVWGAEELDLLEGRGVYASEEVKANERKDGKGSKKRLSRRELFDDIKTTRGKGILKADERTVEREMGYAKSKITLAPQNPSPWNYLKGVLRRAGRSLTSERSFCESFVRPEGSTQSTGQEADEKDRETDFLSESVRSSHAIDWLAEIYAETGEKEAAMRALESLGTKWDPIRRNYWDYRAGLMRDGGYAGT